MFGIIPRNCQSVIREGPWQTPIRKSRLLPPPKRYSGGSLANATVLCGSIVGHCQTQFGRASTHCRSAIRQNSWSQPGRNFGASLAAGDATFGNSSVHNPGAIPDYDLQRQRHNSATSLAVAEASFESSAGNRQCIFRIVPGNRQGTIRERHSQVRKHHSDIFLATAKRYLGASIRRRSRNRQGANPECHWLQPRRNSGSLLAISIASFCIISGHHQGDVRQSNWSLPTHHSAKGFATARATFGSVLDKSRGAIRKLS